MAGPERRAVPDDLLYTEDHEWARDDEGLVRIGITDFAQDALGDVVFVTVPEVGANVVAGEPMGELESTKSVADVVAPVSGVVEAVNDRLDEAPELVNADPYGEGWIALVRPGDDGWRARLLDASGYRDLTVGDRDRS
jgi:glycine cleavage system H protein